MKELEVIGQKFLSIQVCTSLEDKDEIEKRANSAVWCGTTLGWRLSNRSEAAPVKCADHPERTHYMLDC